MIGNLFRGKSIHADDPNTIGYWLKGSLVTHVSGQYIVKCDESLHIDIDDSNEVWPTTVGRFTGLVDKNDRLIFEGDIVKTKYGRLCIVAWHSSPIHNGWDLKAVSTIDNILHTKPPTEYDLYAKYNLEVVGNVYDNPELLHDNDKDNREYKKQFKLFMEVFKNTRPLIPGNQEEVK